MTIATLVVATRETRDGFLRNTATGRSLAACRPADVQVRLFSENREGLSHCYNRAIEESRGQQRILVFAHDDLHLLDYFWAQRLAEGLEHFDIVGLAGNRRRVPRQPAWAFVDGKLTWDQKENLSGVIGHGKGFPPANLSVFGPPGQPVKLLDGLLLATHNRTFLDHDLRFDERFKFHFYDMDLCRQAEQKGLTCGTWPLALIHESGGNFRSESWQKGYISYLEKWGE